MVNAERIIGFIREYVERAEAKGVVVGLSGGLDSAVTLLLCVKALGPERVLAIHVIDELTEPSDTETVKKVTGELGVKLKIVDVREVLRVLRESLPDNYPGMASANIVPRLRMLVFYYYANALGYLVVGTSNRSELRTGYFTKYGDGAADILPLGSLYKTQVRELAVELGVPEEIIKKTPTAGLWRGQTDEGELGISYEKLDAIFQAMDRGEKLEEIGGKLGLEPGKIEEIIERERKNWHKRLPPPVPR